MFAADYPRNHTNCRICVASCQLVDRDYWHHPARWLRDKATDRIISSTQGRSGEIGIRTRLKIWRGHTHVGSSPTSGTKLIPTTIHFHLQFVTSTSRRLESITDSHPIKESCSHRSLFNRSMNHFSCAKPFIPGSAPSLQVKMNIPEPNSRSGSRLANG